MGNLETNERNFVPHDRFEIDHDRYSGPGVEIEATFELIDKIPKGEWTIPETYKSEHTERTWPLDWSSKENSFIKTPPSRLDWVERTDKMLIPWVVFIDKVALREKFYKKNEEMEGAIVDGDTISDSMHEDYRSVTYARVDKKQVSKHLKSLRRGFITLLSKSARKEQGVKRLPKVKPEDMENVRHLVDMFNRKYGGLPFGYCRSITPSK